MLRQAIAGAGLGFTLMAIFAARAVIDAVVQQQGAQRTTFFGSTHKFTIDLEVGVSLENRVGYYARKYQAAPVVVAREASPVVKKD